MVLTGSPPHAVSVAARVVRILRLIEKIQDGENTSSFWTFFLVQTCQVPQGKVLLSLQSASDPTLGVYEGETPLNAEITAKVRSGTFVIESKWRPDVSKFSSILPLAVCSEQSGLFYIFIFL